jgi:DNA-binding CsgD family transcriptional regulator
VSDVSDADLPDVAQAAMLIEVSSDAGTARIPARRDVISIGRAADNDVVVAGEQTVSRYHAELSRLADGWAVRDLGSHNGTHVNGTRLSAAALCPITVDDVVGVGTATLRLVPTDPGDGMTIADERGAAMHRLLTALSQREREVLALVAAGRTDDQVASELFISVKTVHSHLDRIRDKSGVRRRAELTRLAVRLGLSTPRG